MSDYAIHIPGRKERRFVRVLLIFVVLVSGLGAMAAATPADAWYDRYGRWHPNYYHRYYPHAYYRPPAYYYRPRIYAPRPYYRPPPPVFYPRPY